MSTQHGHLLKRTIFRIPATANLFMKRMILKYHCKVIQIRLSLLITGRSCQKEKNHRFLRVACMAVVFAVLFFGGTITSYAFGYDLWGAFAHWTRETFGFAYVTPMDHPKSYSSLQDALSHYGITEPLAPTWIPDGYTLQSVDVSETPAST